MVHTHGTRTNKKFQYNYADTEIFGVNVRSHMEYISTMESKTEKGDSNSVCGNTRLISDTELFLSMIKTKSWHAGKQMLIFCDAKINICFPGNCVSNKCPGCSRTSVRKINKLPQ